MTSENVDYAPHPHYMQLISTVSPQNWAFFSYPLILQMLFKDGPSSCHVMFALKLPHKINYKLRHQVSDSGISDSAGLAALRLLVQRGRGARSGPQTPAAAHRHHHAGDIVLVSNSQPEPNI